MSCESSLARNSHGDSVAVWRLRLRDLGPRISCGLRTRLHRRNQRYQLPHSRSNRPSQRQPSLQQRRSVRGQSRCRNLRLPVSGSLVFPDGGFPPTPTISRRRDSRRAQARTTRGGFPTSNIFRFRFRFAGMASTRNTRRSGRAEFYRPVSDILPPYYYQPCTTNNGSSAPIAGTEYAPPGYEAREYKTRPVCPSSRHHAAVPITPEERQKFVTRGAFPGSFLVPGTNTSFRLRGFVRLTGMYDFKPIGTPDIFVTNSIPVPQRSGQNANATARPSRIALETWTPTSIPGLECPHVHRSRLLQWPGTGGGRRRKSVPAAARVRRFRLLPRRSAEHGVHGRQHLAEPRRLPGSRRLGQPAAARARG